MKRILLAVTAVLGLAMLVVPAMAQTGYPNTQSSPTTPQQGTPTEAQTTPAQAQSTSDAPVTTSSELPATASPLPLVGSMSLAAMAAGALLSRRRRGA